MQRFEIYEYMEVGCMQVERGPMLIAGLGLHSLTDGKMCDRCPKFQHGKCESYKELTRSAAQRKREAVASILPTETVRQESDRLGVSISEVRRRRREQPNAEVEPHSAAGKD